MNENFNIIGNVYLRKSFLILCFLFGFVYISLSQLTKEQGEGNSDTV